MSKVFKLIVINRPPCLPPIIPRAPFSASSHTNRSAFRMGKPPPEMLYRSLFLILCSHIAFLPHLTSSSYLNLLHLSSWASHQPQTGQHLILCYHLTTGPLVCLPISQGGQVTSLKQANIWSCVTILPHESRTLTTGLSLPPLESTWKRWICAENGLVSFSTTGSCSPAMADVSLLWL